MKILLTGAHFTPAVAVIEQLKKYPDVQIVYVGRETTQEGDCSKSRESQIIPESGVKFIPITAGRLQREFTFYTIPSILKIPIGFFQAFYIILKESPDAILSFGGYVAVPLVFAGWLLSIPILIHEQTLVSGLANRISAIFANKIALSFGKSQPKREKVILTGNPLRPNIINPIKRIPVEYLQLLKFSKKNGLPKILVMGGNQGSHALNLVIEKCLSKLSKISCLIHQTGDTKFKDFERLQEFISDKYLVKKWIGEELGAIISQVDLVICRAGANTLSELAYFGKPALVIPLQLLYQDEQKKNAKFFADLGLVQILNQSQLSAETLIKNIRLMLGNLNSISQTAKNARKVIIDGAAKRLALETVILAQR